MEVRMRNSILRSLALVAALGMAVLVTIGASAHDVHNYPKVTLALGWLHEPAYVGFDNAVQVLVKDAAGNAITTITDKDLTVEVSLGSQKMAAKAMLPTADPDTGLGIPGEYEMHFIPTAPGDYTFHLKGSVAGQAIDETVTASDKTFNTVVADDQVEFPAKVPAAADLATKLDQVSSRTDSGKSAADAAKSAADRALYVAVAGVVLAILLGGFSAMRRRRQ
jgi:hypothetical protein